MPLSWPQFLAWFGAQAPNALADYRRLAWLRLRTGTLDRRLADLRTQHQRLAERHGDEITNLQRKLNEDGERLTEWRRELDGLHETQLELDAKLDSPWGRCKVYWQSMTSDRSGGDTIGDLEIARKSLIRRIDQRSGEVEDLSHRLTGTARDLRDLTGPLDSLEFAIDQLETRRREALDEAVATRQRLESICRQTTANPAPLLRELRLQMAIPSADREPLRRLLDQARAPARQPASEAPNARTAAWPPLRTLVENGFDDRRQDVDDRLRVTGRGVAVRWEREEGTTKRHETPVRLAGQVTADYRLHWRGWSPDRLGETLAKALHTQGRTGIGEWGTNRDQASPPAAEPALAPAWESAIGIGPGKEAVDQLSKSEIRDAKSEIHLPFA